MGVGMEIAIVESVHAAKADVSPQVWTDEQPRNLLLESQLVLPRKGAISKFVRRSLMSSQGRTADIAMARDRIVLCKSVFPAAAARAGNILFVGVRGYTADYPTQLERGGGTCWTIDCDPAAAIHGAQGRHEIGSVLDIARHFPDLKFRTIILAGVLGFGVNRRADQIAAVKACSDALESNGDLVLSWNDRRVHPSVFETLVSRWLDYRAYGALPARLWVTGTDQNFAFFRNKPEL